MTEPEDPSRERLKHHFAQRVIHQARQILEIWQRLQRNEWSTQELAELSEANLRLLRFAERFEQPEHSQLARQIGLSLALIFLAALTAYVSGREATGIGPVRAVKEDW